MTLAGNEHPVSRDCGFECTHDGGAAVALDAHRRARGDGCTDGSDDGVRILTARIVVGEHHRIGQAAGHGAHERALAPIPIPTATEHAHDAPGAVFTTGRQRLRQRIGGMGIVHHCLRARAATQPLHAPRYRPNHGQAPQGLIPRDSAPQQCAQHQQGIGHVESPQQG